MGVGVCVCVCVCACAHVCVFVCVCVCVCVLGGYVIIKVVSRDAGLVSQKSSLHAHN